MKISIQVYGNLRSTSTVGPAKTEYHTNPGATVRDLLSELNIWESDIRRVLVNGQEVRLNAKLRARDSLEFY